MTIRQLQIETARSLPLGKVHRRRLPAAEIEPGVSGTCRTPLAARMLELRRQVERKGDRLLSLEDVQDEVKARRGELD